MKLLKEKSICKISKSGCKFWYNQKGQLHREDGPATEYTSGTKEWYQNDERHREDGPAVENSDGTKYWYKNGKLHRKDGPAIEFPNGHKEWHLNGIKYSEKEYNLKVIR